jgi:acetamidase/formamidase
MIHELPFERRVMHGHFSRDLAPALTIDSGDSIRFTALNAGWRWREGGPPAYDDLGDDLEGHALVGPVAVRGARPGQTLAVRIDDLRPAQWGVTIGGDEAFEWELDADAGRATDRRGFSVALAPFLGVIGMPPPEDGRHPTGPPRPSGGNLDCKELVAGTTLLLPVPVDGALLSAGDGHAAQGDGEVSGTAIECAMERAQLTLSVRDDIELRMPLARTAGAWIAFGLDEDLDAAADLALETMLDLMERGLRVERDHALALASVAVDLRVTQVVNGVKGVHAVLRDDAIRLPDLSAGD